VGAAAFSCPIGELCGHTESSQCRTAFDILSSVIRVPDGSVELSFKYFSRLVFFSLLMVSSRITNKKIHLILMCQFSYSLILTSGPPQPTFSIILSDEMVLGFIKNTAPVAKSERTGRNTSWSTPYFAVMAQSWNDF
jgi:hypothetical protein